MYYNFHAMAKRLIAQHNTIGATIFEAYHNIRPALVIYFKNHAPIPIRQYMWHEYLPLLRGESIKILNPANLPTNLDC